MHILFWRGACRRRFYGQALLGLMMGALAVALGLFLVGCGSGGSGGSGAPTCDISEATIDCDEDGVLNGDDEFPRDACASVDDDGDGVADMAHSGVAACSESAAVRIDNCIGIANSDQTNSDNDADGDACDTDDDNDGEPDESDVDADGDGLIEIADALQFNNIRHNLAGSSYDDEAADTSPADTGDDTGCPAGGCTGYELSGDIDLKDIANWVPIGETDAAPFVANFDGNGFMVANMAINASSGDRFGLFGSVGDTTNVFMFRDVHIQGAITYSGSASAVIGGLIGRIWRPSDGRDVSVIDGCSSAVDITGGSGTNQAIGGLVGESEAEIRNSWASGTIQSCDGCMTGSCTCTGGGFIGGLVGISNRRIRNSFSIGAVSGNVVVGGLVGDSFVSIHNSYATGAVNSGARRDSIGGLVGRLSSFHRIVNSYAIGAVDGGAGGSSPSFPQRVGGLAVVIGGTITNSYSSGTASGTGSNNVINTVGMVDAQQLMGCGVEAALGSFGGDCSALYVGWSSTNWDFGDASQFPALKSYVDDPGEDGVLLCGQPGSRVTRPECTTDVKVPLP